MDSELKIMRAQIVELRSQLELERKGRKKVESMNKRLAKELLEERKGTEGVERLCGELAEEMASDKVTIDGMRREMEEERKMLRMVEALREERVQMKLREAKILLEEKLLELELNFTKPNTGGIQLPSTSSFAFPADERAEAEEEDISNKTCNEVATSAILTVCGTYSNNSNSNSTISSSCLNNDNGAGRSTSTVSQNQNQKQRRASLEAENPHIKRGIRGFVEFPRVVRAIGPRGSHSGSNLKCQKAQLRLVISS